MHVLINQFYWLPHLHICFTSIEIFVWLFLFYIRKKKEKGADKLKLKLRLKSFSIYHDNMGVVTGNNWCCYVKIWQTFSWKPVASAWLSLEERVRSSSVNTRLGSWKLPSKYTGTLNNEGSKLSSGSLWIAAQREKWVKTGRVTAVWNQSIVSSLAFHCCALVKYFKCSVDKVWMS